MYCLCVNVCVLLQPRVNPIAVNKYIKINMKKKITLTEVFLLWVRFIRAFSPAVKQMPGCNSQRRGTARTLPKLIVLFYVLFVCKCVLYYRQRVSPHLQLKNVSISIYHTCFDACICIVLTFEYKCRFCASYMQK